jgi:pimeloyl-ACP methyl ester carboxylesterase
MVAEAGACGRGPLSRIPSPILLVHGFGGSGVAWEKNYGVVPYFESLGLRFGGTPSPPGMLVARSNQRGRGGRSPHNAPFEIKIER